jgi:hypothetical protein
MSVDIVGLHEIAQRTGYAYGTVAQWHSQGKVKDPDVVLACGPIWEWPALREWLIEHDKIDRHGKRLQFGWREQNPRTRARLARHRASRAEATEG